MSAVTGNPLLLGSALAWLAALAVIDARTGRLPNRLTLPALAVLTTLAALTAPAVFAAAGTAAAPYAVGFGRHACGGGDVKLAAACGLLLGSVPAALLLLSTAAAITLGWCALRRVPRAPHGPALAVATIVLQFCLVLL